MWSNTWPSAGLVPNKGYSLTGPIHRRKHPEIRNPSSDPKAPRLLPTPEGLGENQVGCPGGKSVGSRARSLLRAGTPGAQSPEKELQVGAEQGLGLALETRLPSPSRHREGGWNLQATLFAAHWVEVGATAAFFLPFLQSGLGFLSQSGKSP